MNRDSEFTSCLGIIVSLLVVFTVGTLLNGWALSTIWNWFIPSVFGLTTLTIGKAIGVSMVFELFTGTSRLAKAKSDSDVSNKSYGAVFVESLVISIITPVLTVFFAYIVFQFAF